MASHFVDGATEYRESKETAPEHTVNSHMKSYTQIHRLLLRPDIWNIWSRNTIPSLRQEQHAWQSW